MDIYRNIRDDQWKNFEDRNRMFRYVIRMRYQIIIDFLKKIMPVNILDVGCGDGILEFLIKKEWPSVKITGIDIGWKNLAVAKEKSGKLSFIEADARVLPVKNKSFDAVVCSEVLEHLDNPETCLDELERVTRKYLIVTTPNAFSWKILKYIFKYPFIGVYNVLNSLRIGYYDDSYYGKAPLHRYFFVGYLIKLLEERGFDIANVGVTSFWDSVFKYLPDFYIPILDSYVEVKPSINLEQDDMYGILDLYKYDLENKWKPFSKNKNLLIAIGTPHAKCMWLLLNEKCYSHDGMLMVIPFAYLMKSSYGKYWYSAGDEDWNDEKPFKKAITNAKSARFNTVEQ